MEVKSARFGFPKNMQVNEITPDVLKRLRDARKNEGNDPSTVDRELSLIRELIKRASDMHNPSMTLEAAPLHPHIHIRKLAAPSIKALGPSPFIPHVGTSPLPVAAPTVNAVINITAFTDAQRASIEALRLTLSRRVSRAVTADYGADEGQHWAALCVKSLPIGSFGRPGPLVSILRGANVRGGAAVMDSDGFALGDVVDFDEAIKTACFAGIRSYRALTAGAVH